MEPITAKELIEFFPEETPLKELENLANTLNYFCRQHEEETKHQNKLKAEHKKLEAAKQQLMKAMDSLKAAKQGLGAGTYKALVCNPEEDSETSELLERIQSTQWKQQDPELDKLLNRLYSKRLSQNTFTNICAQIINCIPDEKPTHIEIKHFFPLLEIVRISCERLNPCMGWYTGTDNKYSGKFFFLSKLLAERLGIKRGDRTIRGYLGDKVIPNRKAMGNTKEKMKEIVSALSDEKQNSAYISFLVTEKLNPSSPSKSILKNERGLEKVDFDHLIIDDDIEKDGNLEIATYSDEALEEFAKQFDWPEDKGHHEADS